MTKKTTTLIIFILAYFSLLMGIITDLKETPTDFDMVVSGIITLIGTLVLIGSINTLWDKIQVTKFFKKLYCIVLNKKEREELESYKTNLDIMNDWIENMKCENFEKKRSLVIPKPKPFYFDEYYKVKSELNDPRFKIYLIDGKEYQKIRITKIEQII